MYLFSNESTAAFNFPEERTWLVGLDVHYQPINIYKTTQLYSFGNAPKENIDKTKVTLLPSPLYSAS
jgi:hypothetical protein